MSPIEAPSTLSAVCVSYVAGTTCHIRPGHVRFTRSAPGITWPMQISSAPPLHCARALPTDDGQLLSGRPSEQTNSLFSQSERQRNERGVRNASQAADARSPAANLMAAVDVLSMRREGIARCDHGGQPGPTRQRERPWRPRIRESGLPSVLVVVAVIHIVVALTAY